MELIPLIALFAIAAISQLAELVGSHPWVATLALGVPWLALLQTEIGVWRRDAQEPKRAVLRALPTPSRACFGRGSG